MARETFIKRLCKSIRPSYTKEIYDEEDERVYDDSINDKIVEVNVMKEFFVPSSTVFKKVKTAQPLTKEEIEEYITYVINNYYISNYDKDTLDDFCVEWSRCKLLDENLISRKNLAFSNLVRALRNGQHVDVMDALWASEKIFVDDDIIKNMRIITKDNGTELNVVSQMKNPTISKQILQLKKAILQKNTSKQLDNNY